MSSMKLWEIWNENLAVNEDSTVVMKVYLSPGSVALLRLEHVCNKSQQFMITLRRHLACMASEDPNLPLYPLRVAQGRPVWRVLCAKDREGAIHEVIEGAGPLIRDVAEILKLALDVIAKSEKVQP